MKILDSSCLIYLFKRIDEPNVVLTWKKQGYAIVIPSCVQQEISKNDETLAKVNPHIQSGSISVINCVSDEEIKKFKTRHPVLGNGEISVILTAVQLAEKSKRYYAVIDDTHARRVANKYNIHMTDTFGLLYALKEKDLIPPEYYISAKEKLKQHKCLDVDRLEYEHRSKH